MALTLPQAIILDGICCRHSVIPYYSSSNLSAFICFAIAFYRSFDDAHDHETLTAPASRSIHDPMFCHYHFHFLSQLGWRRLISYELFPFLAALLARLRACWGLRGDSVEMMTMYRARQYKSFIVFPSAIMA